MVTLIGGLMVGYLMMFVAEFLVLNFLKISEDVKMTAKIKSIEEVRINKKENRYRLLLSNGMRVYYFGQKQMVEDMTIEFEGNKAYLYRSLKEQSYWSARPVIHDVKCLSKGCSRNQERMTKTYGSYGFGSFVNNPKGEQSFVKLQPRFADQKEIGGKSHEAVIDDWMVEDAENFN